MTEQEKIIKQTDPKVIVVLTPHTNIAKTIMWGLASGSLLSRLAFDRPFEKALIAGGCEAGDIRDAINKQVKCDEMFLTETSIVLLYRKGMLSKKVKFISLPMQYAKSVKEFKQLRHRFLRVDFSVPSEDKIMEFDIRIGALKELDIWLKELERIVSVQKR